MARHSSSAPCSFLMPDRRGLRSRLHHPRRRDAAVHSRDAGVVEDVDEVRTADAGAAGAAAHRQLVAKRARRRLAHARHAEIFAQHRRELDVEVVERDDAIDLLGAGDVRRALADVLGRHVAAEVVELVHGVARPVGIAQLLLGQEQHAASLPAALAQELVAFAVGRDAEDRQRHSQSSKQWIRPRALLGPAACKGNRRRGESGETHPC